MTIHRQKILNIKIKLSNVKKKPKQRLQHDQVGFIQRIQGWVTIRKAINPL